MLKPLEKHHLKMILAWRNNPAVRACMYTQHEISMSEHKRWFKRLAASDTHLCFIFYADSEPAGVVQFTDLDMAGGHAFWGFYLAPSVSPLVSVALELSALSFAFDTLKLRKLSCEVLEHNKKVLNLHKKTGFSVEGRFLSHYFDGENFQDIFRLAIFSSGWSAAKGRLKARLSRGSLAMS